MTGLLYKECRQNRWFLLLTVAIAFLVMFFPIVFMMTGENIAVGEAFREVGSGKSALRTVFIVIGLMFIGAMQGMTLMGDDTKSWALFVASNPQGIKGYLYNKYLLIFAMSGLLLVSEIVADYLFGTIAYCLNRQEVGVMSDTFIFLFYVQIFLRAIELPFFVRFGIKKGNLIKTITLITLVVAFFVLLLLNPGGMVENIFDAIYSFKNNQSTDMLVLLVGMFPVVSMVAYYLSYRLSCRFYMKGVEQYD